MTYFKYNRPITTVDMSQSNYTTPFMPIEFLESCDVALHEH